MKEKITFGQKMSRGFRVESGSPFGVHYFDQSKKGKDKQKIKK